MAARLGEDALRAGELKAGPGAEGQGNGALFKPGRVDGAKRQCAKVVSPETGVLLRCNPSHPNACGGFWCILNPYVAVLNEPRP